MTSWMHVIEYIISSSSLIFIIHRRTHRHLVIMNIYYSSSNTASRCHYEYSLFTIKHIINIHYSPPSTVGVTPITMSCNTVHSPVNIADSCWHLHCQCRHVCVESRSSADHQTWNWPPCVAHWLVCVHQCLTHRLLQPIRDRHVIDSRRITLDPWESHGNDS